MRKVTMVPIVVSVMIQPALVLPQNELIVPTWTWTEINDPVLGSVDMCRGAAWGDFDNDGDEDLFLTRHEEKAVLLRYTETNTFEIVTPGPEFPSSAKTHRAAWGDYDNDNDLDLFVTSWNAGNRLFRNDGNGQFSDVTTPELSLGPTHGSNEVLWFDYDNDNDLDVFVTSPTYGPGSDLIRNDGGDLWSARDIFYYSPAYYPNNPSAPAMACYAAIPGDFDDDGDLDLFLGGHMGSQVDNLLYVNNGTHFMNATRDVGIRQYDKTNGAAWRDFDNDGDLDLIAGYSVWNNNGDRTFSKVLQSGLPYYPNDMSHMSAVDYDGDGLTDLFYTHWESCYLYRNLGNLQFQDVTNTDFLIIPGAKQSVWADYDNDGDVDVVLVQSTPLLLRNDGPGSVVVRLEEIECQEEENVATIRWSVSDIHRSVEFMVEANSDEISRNVPVLRVGEKVFEAIDNVLDGSLLSRVTYSILARQEGAAWHLLGEKHLEVIARNSLHAYNYPNPFNPSTTIHFTIPNIQPVRLTVYGVDGRLVSTLANGEMASGSHEVTWNGQDEHGHLAASGTYIYRLDAGPFSETRRMVLVR